MHPTDILHVEGEHLRAAPGFWECSHAYVGATSETALAHPRGLPAPPHSVSRYVASIHHGGGGPVLAQTTADRGGEHERGEKEVSSHTSLHTNLSFFRQSCARSTGTGGRQRWLSGLKHVTSYPEM